MFYKVSEIQKWIDDNLLELKITPVNETINLLDSPKKILCLGKIIGSEENQSAKLSTIEDKNLTVTIGTNIPLFNSIKVFFTLIIIFLFSQFTKRRLLTFLVYDFLFLLLLLIGLT